MSKSYVFAGDGQMILPWAVRKGSTNKLKFALGGGTPFVATDLTGWAARLQIREAYDSAAAVLSITETLSADGIIVLGGVLGTIEIKLDPDSTSALTITKGVYDMEVVDSLGDVRNFVGGKVEILPEVTR